MLRTAGSFSRLLILAISVLFSLYSSYSSISALEKCKEDLKTLPSSSLVEDQLASIGDGIVVIWVIFGTTILAVCLFFLGVVNDAFVQLANKRYGSFPGRLRGFFDRVHDLYDSFGTFLSNRAADLGMLVATSLLVINLTVLRSYSPVLAEFGRRSGAVDSPDCQDSREYLDGRFADLKRVFLDECSVKSASLNEEKSEEDLRRGASALGSSEGVSTLPSTSSGSYFSLDPVRSGRPEPSKKVETRVESLSVAPGEEFQFKWLGVDSLSQFHRGVFFHYLWVSNGFSAGNYRLLFPRWISDLNNPDLDDRKRASTIAQRVPGPLERGWRLRFADRTRHLPVAQVKGRILECSDGARTGSGGFRPSRITFEMRIVAVETGAVLLAVHHSEETSDYKQRLEDRFHEWIGRFWELEGRGGGLSRTFAQMEQ